MLDAQNNFFFFQFCRKMINVSKCKKQSVLRVDVQYLFWEYSCWEMKSREFPLRAIPRESWILDVTTRKVHQFREHGRRLLLKNPARNKYERFKRIIASSTLLLPSREHRIIPRALQGTYVVPGMIRSTGKP